MRFVDPTLRLSPTDLSNHLDCHHLTQLDLAVARGERDKPDWYDPRAEVLRERGYEHEGRYLEQLRAEGLEVVEVPGHREGVGDRERVERTLALMRRGADGIAQGALADGRWFGLPDVLRKIDRPSELGAWSYEVVDTKLARETRGATVLQLCLYSELVAAVQGALPERMYVVSPGEKLVARSYRVEDYLAYHRWVKGRLLRVVAEDGGDGATTYPEPVERCRVCSYWQECDERRRADDHLSLVAGAGRSQRRELEARGISTLTRLAEEPIPLAWKPDRGARATYERLREQARVQLEGRGREDGLYHELLEREPERGLARLPEPDPADVFFDFEGDAFVGTAGLEYIFGWVVLGADGKPVFEHHWAHDAASEKRAFEDFVDRMIERLEGNENFHVYHFTSYEPAALKRLMGRYASREAEVDRLLRGEVFVDLHSVVRQALRAAVERYSLKDLEPYCGFERQLGLDEARRARYRVERLLELGQAGEIGTDVLAKVLRYNEEDCLSTLRLRDWLEELRAECVAAGEEIARPEPGDGGPSEEISKRQAEVQKLRERLTAEVPPDESRRSPEQRASWLVAHLVDYHWREQKVVFWEKFRLRDMDADDLFDERAGISGLELVGELEQSKRARTPLHRYRFPAQEVKLKKREEVHFGERKIGELVDFDLEKRILDLKKTGETAAVHPPAVFLHRYIRPEPKPKAIFQFAEGVAEEGWEAVEPGRAARDLLLRLPPRLRAPASEEPGPIGVDVSRGEDLLASAKRLALTLDRGVLPIQGPPGSGKTYTGARMALELIQQGRKVGVSAVSHRVIQNLLTAILDAGEEVGLEVRCAHRDRPRESHDRRVEVTQDYGALRTKLAEGEIQVLAGTAWLWAREEFEESVDVLFLDEAGQMSLADVVASARGARSLVLLGDPRQLDQPQRGSHPEGTHVSALEHLLDGAKTLPEGAGLFLAETYRLHPELCDFTSEVFYENRLRPVPGLERQRLAGPVLEGAGLWHLAVEHEGNQSASPEEVVAIGRLMERLVDGTSRWTDKDGKTQPLALDDILVVAPYNAQVQALKERLPDGARVGTVDKFQGQEAPVVVFSTATSSPELAPRGMEFLYDASRLNVATSRAKAACVLVGSPRIFEPECRTPRQIKLANAFCRYLELARELRVS